MTPAEYAEALMDWWMDYGEGEHVPSDQVVADIADTVEDAVAQERQRQAARWATPSRN